MLVYVLLFSIILISPPPQKKKNSGGGSKWCTFCTFNIIRIQRGLHCVRRHARELAPELVCNL
jgi:hypothetical protein